MTISSSRCSDQDTDANPQGWVCADERHQRWRSCNGNTLITKQQGLLERNHPSRQIDFCRNLLSVDRVHWNPSSGHCSGPRWAPYPTNDTARQAGKGCPSHSRAKETEAQRNQLVRQGEALAELLSSCGGDGCLICWSQQRRRGSLQGFSGVSSSGWPLQKTQTLGRAGSPSTQPRSGS